MKKNIIIWMGLTCVLAAGSLWTGCAPVAPGNPDNDDEAPQPSSISRETPSDHVAVLEAAISHLEAAQSYALRTTSIRAYTSELDGDARTVYGEFIEDIRINFNPFQVEKASQYRFDPNTPFVSETIYYYKEGDRFHQRIVEEDGGGTSATIPMDEVFPCSSDILNAVTQYYSVAEYIGTQDGVARYEFKHPEWYRMKSAVMFADMGMLYTQEDAESAIETYAKEQYPDIAPIVFTIDVNTDTGYIRQVRMNDGAFMMSIWEAVADAAIREGGSPEQLPVYTVLSENGTTYEFSQWNIVEEIELPK